LPSAFRCLGVVGLRPPIGTWTYSSCTTTSRTLVTTKTLYITLGLFLTLRRCAETSLTFRNFDSANATGKNPYWICTSARIARAMVRCSRGNHFKESAPASNPPSTISGVQTAGAWCCAGLSAVPHKFLCLHVSLQ
jgi:hypothetical protein